MNTRFRLSRCAWIGMLLFACSPEPAHVFTATKFLMGTPVTITLYIPAEPIQALSPEQMAQNAFNEIARLEAMLSTRNPDGPLARIERQAGLGPVQVEPELFSLLQQAGRVSLQTQGAFDVSIEPLVRLWDIHQRRVPPTEAEIQQRLPWVDYRCIRLDPKQSTVQLAHPKMALGLGAIAKGYTAGLIGRLLKAQGARHFIVAMGGDIWAEGTKGNVPWRAGIVDPDSPDQLLVSWNLKTPVAMSTSGGYRSRFEHQGKFYHHILDPRTGHPASGLKSATVLAKDPGLADAYATAFFVMGPQRSLELVKLLPDVALIMVDESDRMIQAGNLNAFISGPQDGQPVKPRKLISATPPPQ